MGIAKLGFLRSFGRRHNAGQHCNETLFQRYHTTGDNAALSTLYDRHSNPLYYYLLVMSDAPTAADITQKAWLKVIEAPHLYQQKKGCFEAWLFTIAHRMLLDELRRTQRWFADTDPETLSEQRLTNDTAPASDSFHSVLQQLPFAQREAFSLQQEGFSLLDIAHICDIPVETAKTRLRYARQNMRKLWTQKP